MNEIKGLPYPKVKTELIEALRAIKAKAVKHYYPTGEIARVYNEVFSKKENPTSCSSCNRAWVRALNSYLAGYETYLKSLDAGVVDTEDARTSVLITTATGLSIRVYDDLSAEAEPIEDTPEDGIDGVYMIDEGEDNHGDRLVIVDGYARFIAVSYKHEDLVNPQDTAEQIDLLKRLIILEDPEDKESAEKVTIAHKSPAELAEELAALVPEVKAEPLAGSPAGLYIAADSEPQETYALEDGRMLVVDSDGIGLVDGKRMRAGTYELKDGAGKVSVNVTGKVKYKAPEDSVI